MLRCHGSSRPVVTLCLPVCYHLWHGLLVGTNENKFADFEEAELDYVSKG